MESDKNVCFDEINIQARIIHSVTEILLLAPSDLNEIRYDLLEISREAAKTIQDQIRGEVQS